MEKSLQKIIDTGAVVFSNLTLFKNSHIKCLYLPEKELWIGTTNFDVPTDHEGKTILNEGEVRRDFCLILDDEKLMKEFDIILHKVIENETISWPTHSIQEDLKTTLLSWGPTQHKKDIIDLINGAQKSIKIYQQDLQDSDIKDALLKALDKNVQIQILMSKHPFGENKENKSLKNLNELKEKGANVILTGERFKDGHYVHIHAKVLMIDDTRMYLGSANFYGPTLDPHANELNVGVITQEKKYINPVLKQFDQDWKDHAHML